MRNINTMLIILCLQQQITHPNQSTLDQLKEEMQFHINQAQQQHQKILETFNKIRTIDPNWQPEAINQTINYPEHQPALHNLLYDFYWGQKLFNEHAQQAATLSTQVRSLQTVMLILPLINVRYIVLNTAQ